jgi:hypothetical protein
VSFYSALLPPQRHKEHGGCTERKKFAFKAINDE